MGRRAIVLVLDGCGAGAAPDAADFNDAHGPSTLLNVWNHVGGFSASTLADTGFLAAGLIPLEPKGLPGRRVSYGRLRELSMGKDSVTGHWEMMGIHTREPFPTYPGGFPISLIKEFEERIGTQTLGNKPSSGTAILDELGELHIHTGFPIVYTSADSVFQIATQEDRVPIETLYEWCGIARELLVAPNHVARVIARPFIGTQKGGFTRTERRKDFPLVPPLNLIDEVGDVFGVGVVPELFGSRGFRAVRRTQCNAEHAQMLKEAMESDARFIFANFEDFDMLFGHRNDPVGFAKCLETFDGILQGILADLQPDDLLIITSDHGNDPTDESTDHSREYVPVSLITGGEGVRHFEDVDGMMAIGRTVAEWLGVEWDQGSDLLG